MIEPSEGSEQPQGVDPNDGKPEKDNASSGLLEEVTRQMNARLDDLSALQHASQHSSEAGNRQLAAKITSLRLFTCLGGFGGDRPMSRGCRRLVLVLGVLMLFGVPSPCQAGELKLLVPAYGNPCCPGGQEMWAQLTETATTLGEGLVVILNPNSGPGVGAIDPNYVNESGQGAFIDFRNAGGVAIGYVRTDWAMRPMTDVQGEIDLYFDSSYWRGAGVQIDGVFFDEMSNDLADVGYYSALRDYVRGQLATAILVGNPGTTFVNNPTGQTTWSVADYAESADTLVTFENIAEEYFDNYTPPSWVDSYSADRFGHIVYGVSTTAQMLSAMSLAKQRNAGFVYLTDDVLMNPYDALASYWQAEVDAACGLVFADGFESGDLASWGP